MEQSTDPRQDWEITWHIFLQVAVGYLTMTEATCRAIGINRVESANRAVCRADALVAKHGAPGSAALSAAEATLETLRGVEGLVSPTIYQDVV